MDFYKQFSFVGNLKKLHENDSQPIENFPANIQCHRNGEVFLEVDSITYKSYAEKRFYEATPIYQYTNPQKFQGNEIIDHFCLPTIDVFEKELLQKPYKGDYIIEGKTDEGWTLIAEIADPNFTVSFGDEINQEQDTKEYFVRLMNLSIDYHPDCTKDKEVQMTYGIANLQLSENILTNFLDSKYEFSLTRLLSYNKDKPEELSAEMILRAIQDENEQISYTTYFAWFELLISFATGKCLKEIYRTEISQSSDGQKKVEYWSGSQLFKQGRGIAVIHQGHLASFIEQCASKVTWENFSDKGLGSALRWYTETFSSNTVSVEFIFLCIVLETLNKHHSTQMSSRLLPKSNYKEIREKILTVLNEYEQNINSNEIKSQYQIFRKKVEKSFAEGSFNQIGSLRTSLKQMLEFYNTPYKDLFPNLEFLVIRDDIVHTGFGGENISSALLNLINLVVRLVLSILQYQGNYTEYIKLQIGDSVDCEKFDLAYKTFPFESDH